MATPTEKSPRINELLDSIIQSRLGRTESIMNDVVVTCTVPAFEFIDSLSHTEYNISGMCQTCQDEVFGGEEF